MIRKAPSLSAAVVFALLALSINAHGQATDAPKVEVGAQFSTLSVRRPDFFNETEHQPGFGGRLTYNLTDNVALEAEGNFFPTRGTTSISTGGRALQGQFGVKAGRRFDRFGVFAKARPGLVSFDGALQFRGTENIIFEGQTFTVPRFQIARKTHFSTDLGGVLEFYPSRRIVTRFDFGDTIIRYGQRETFGSASQPIVNAPSTIRHNFQFTAGVGFRF
jgi:hypothetical protein